MAEEIVASEPNVMDAVYSERNQVVAHLAALYESWLTVDPAEPDWPVIAIDLPSGQVTWHISRDDLHYFEGAKWAHEHPNPKPYDGHTTVEKYQRLNEYTRYLRSLQNG